MPTRHTPPTVGPTAALRGPAHGWPLIPTDAEALRASMQSLRLAAQAGKDQPLLRGLHLALLCDDDGTPSALRFRRAALELGAQVTPLKPTLTEQSGASEVRRTARLLGQLYDAIECQGTAQALTGALSLAAGVPVFDGLATATHPLWRLGVALADGPADEDGAHHLLQAALIYALR